MRRSVRTFGDACGNGATAARSSDAAAPTLCDGNVMQDVDARATALATLVEIVAPKAVEELPDQVVVPSQRHVSRCLAFLSASESAGQAVRLRVDKLCVSCWKLSWLYVVRCVRLTLLPTWLQVVGMAHLLAVMEGTDAQQQGLALRVTRAICAAIMSLDEVHVLSYDGDMKGRFMDEVLLSGEREVTRHA